MTFIFKVTDQFNAERFGNSFIEHLANGGSIEEMEKQIAETINEDKWERLCIEYTKKVYGGTVHSEFGEIAFDTEAQYNWFVMKYSG